MALREIVVISGKGGTGKTSVTASLIPYFRDTLLADCDVDAPDLDILLEPQITRKETVSASRKAVADGTRCTGCGTCLSVCRFSAVKLRGGQAEIDPVKCEGCKVCTLVCSADALSLKEWVTGDLYESETLHGPMVHARLVPGEEVSGRLVSLVRQRARERAEADGCNTVLIDGPPGVACNVISSITGADLALIVAEPTLSGFHDMKRVWETAGKIRVRTAVLINKAGLEHDLGGAIREFARENDIPLLGEIPLSDDVRRAVNRREIPSLALPDFPEVRFWENLVEKIEKITYNH